MKEYYLAEGEAKFADVIWEHEPVGSTQLVRLCEEKFGWKKSTTYTVLKKLCGKGLFQNKDAVVTSRVTKEEFESGRSRQFVEESFGGSLPKFLTAFIGKQRLSNREIEELKALIENYKE